MTDKEAMQMALDVLKKTRVFVTTREKIKHPEGTDWYDYTIEALRAQLEQGEQEPYGYLWFTRYMEHRFTHRIPNENERIGDVKPVYTAPPQRTWQGLTDEEIEMRFIQNECCDDLVVFENIARAIEAALKEKNAF